MGILPHNVALAFLLDALCAFFLIILVSWMYIRKKETHQVPLVVLVVLLGVGVILTSTYGVTRLPPKSTTTGQVPYERALPSWDG